ncbi:uncharacterized protein LOC144354123 [Saccoglossus kowalevskii]
MLACLTFFKVPISRKNDCKLLGGPNGPEYKEDSHIWNKTTFCFYCPDEDGDADSDALSSEPKSLFSDLSMHNSISSIPSSHSASSQLKHLADVPKVKSAKAKVEVSGRQSTSESSIFLNAQNKKGLEQGGMSSVSVATLLKFGQSMACTALESESPDSNAWKYALQSF